MRKPWGDPRRVSKTQAYKIRVRRTFGAAHRGNPCNATSRDFVAARLDETENHARWAVNPGNVGSGSDFCAVLTSTLKNVGSGSDFCAVRTSCRASGLLEPTERRSNTMCTGIT